MMCLSVCLAWYWWLLIVIGIIVLYATGTAPIVGAILVAVILALLFMASMNSIAGLYPIIWLLVILAIILSPETWPIIVGFAIIALIALLFWKIIVIIGLILGFLLFLLLG